MVQPHVAKSIPFSMRFWAPLFFAPLLALAVGCGAVEPPEAPPLATVELKGASVNALEEWTELVGTTQPLPNRMARISARVEGSVVSVLRRSQVNLSEGTSLGVSARSIASALPNSPVQTIAEGDKVSAGTVLVQLDTTLVKNSLADTEHTQDSLVQEQKQAQLAVDLANREYERLNKLAKEDQQHSRDDRNYIPLVQPLQLEAASTTLKDAQSKLKAANARAGAGESKVEALREQLRLHTLVAPINGRLGRIQVVPGQWLSVGTPVADVIDVDEQIDVLCFVAGSQVHKLEVGQPARTGGIDEPEEGQAVGEIVYIADQAEPETGNFAVKARFSNKEKHLRANRIVRLTVLTKPGRECLNLPESAVQQDQQPPTVVVAEEYETRLIDNKKVPIYMARRLEVVLGVHDRKNHAFEIVSLSDPDKEGDKKKPVPSIKEAKFVVTGAQGLQTGDFLKEDKDED